MISIFREFTKSWVFTGLMGLLILSFAVFGLRDVFSQVGTNNVVTAGKRAVSVDQFKKQFDGYKTQYAQQHNGQSFTNDEFVASGQHTQMLDAIAGQTALGAWFDVQGIKPSAKLIVDQLSQIPAFFNNATGKFDKDMYRSALARAQMDEKDFEQTTGDQIVTQQYGGAIIAGLKAPRIYAATEAAYGLQTRDFSYFVVSPASVPAPPTPTEADIAGFYKAHLDALIVPEMRTAEMVTMSTEQFAATATVSDDDLHKAYEKRLPTLKVAETRTFVEITAPNAAAATAISAALKAGQSPDVVAKANKGTVIGYDNKPQSAVPDEKVAAAAFALKSGDVSGTIQGSLGLAVVKMGDIRIGSTPSFESVRPQIEADLKKERAADQLNKVSHEFADALAKGDDFDASAAKFNLKVIKLPPMTAEGKLMTDHGWSTGQNDDYSRFPAIVKDIYNLQPGATSDVEEMSEGQYFALKLVGVKPAAAPPLAALHDELAKGWQAQKLQGVIQDEAQEVIDRLKKGEPMAKVAADVKGEIKTVQAVDRSGGAQRIPPAITGRVFFAKPGDAFQVPVNQLAVLIGHVDAVHQADATAANTAAASLRPRMMQSVGSDVFDLTRTAARAAVKTVTYPKLAVSALGVTPADATADTKGKDKK